MQLNAALLSLANVEISCHKHFAVLPRHQQTPPLTTSEVSQLAGRWSDGVVTNDNTWPVAALTERSEARYRLRIAISAYRTYIRRPRLGVPVGILLCRLV